MHAQAGARSRQQEHSLQCEAVCLSSEWGLALLMRGVGMQVRMQHSQQQRLCATRIHALPAMPHPERALCAVGMRSSA